MSKSDNLGAKSQYLAAPTKNNWYFEFQTNLNGPLFLFTPLFLGLLDTFFRILFVYALFLYFSWNSEQIFNQSVYNNALLNPMAKIQRRKSEVKTSFKITFCLNNFCLRKSSELFL